MIGGVDYDSVENSVVITAGQTTASLNIPVKDDKILEDNEEFKVSIRRFSLIGRVVLGNPDEATVIIIDDDGNQCIIEVYQIWDHNVNKL